MQSVSEFGSHHATAETAAKRGISAVDEALEVHNLQDAGGDEAGGLEDGADNNTAANIMVELEVDGVVLEHEFLIMQELVEVLENVADTLLQRVDVLMLGAVMRCVVANMKVVRNSTREAFRVAEAEFVLTSLISGESELVLCAPGWPVDHIAVRIAHPQIIRLLPVKPAAAEWCRCHVRRCQRVQFTW